MSYRNAIRMFQENGQLINPSEDPIMFNLNNGLLSLTEQLERDLRHIQNYLDALKKSDSYS